MQFGDAVKQHIKKLKAGKTRTTNGMVAHGSTGSAVLDLFGLGGSMRAQITGEHRTYYKNQIEQNINDLKLLFLEALEEDPELAIRVLLWLRDCRGGAGERKAFTILLAELASIDTDLGIRVALRAPELGRWDDMLYGITPKTEEVILDRVAKALLSGEGLCAKWFPRENSQTNHKLGHPFEKLARYMKLERRALRKLLVANTQVVEQKMSANEWSKIVFDKVPSLALARYNNAYTRHCGKAFREFLAQVEKGEKKVNAGALYPYDVVKTLLVAGNDRSAAQAQWDALPNYVGDANILPLVDVSHSMSSARATTTLDCMTIAISLGLYLAEKNTGAFKDLSLTFSERPQFLHLKGNLSQRYQQMRYSQWNMNTNLERAINEILTLAVHNRVPKKSMPKALLILSDMQFDQAVRVNDRAIDMIRSGYKNAGYEVPKVIFWNLNSQYKNVPVKKGTKGTALISGFSPAILKSVLKLDLEKFDPMQILLETVKNDRYNF